ncbi:hypothetical protein LIER_28983 [Lithospermum erythrorhizon]|uniref:Reverse transcriptase domain-containing protein n=1 Tax=Lithospermum erythrorhizon TaxID=34254 RepID=A0AAV3RHL8_LITER
MVGFYDHHEVSKRKFSWELMRHIDSLSQLPTVYIGDFNEVLFPSEHVSHRRFRPTWQMNLFNQAVKDCGIIDIGCKGYPYTWSNTFIAPISTRAKLDRALAGRDWSTMFPEVVLHHGSTYHSDHLPLFLYLGNQTRGYIKPKPRFRFEASWCLYERSTEVVRDAWNANKRGDPGEMVFQGIRNCRLGLLNWKRVVLGDFQIRMEDKQLDLDLLQFPFILEDVKRGLFSMSGLKSPGPDAKVVGKAYYRKCATLFRGSSFIKNQRQGKKGYMSIKLDKLKAYDRVEWSFLRAMLIKLEFNALWVKVIMDYVTYVSYSVLINGDRTGFFKPSRGGSNWGLLWNPSPIYFLRNDTLLLGEATEDEALAFMAIVGQYEEWSEQKVSVQKSSVGFSPDVIQTKRDTITNILGMSEVATHGKYLGLPTTVGDSKKVVFTSLIERVKLKIVHWKPRLLSKAGSPST